MKQPRIVLIGHVCIDTNISEHATYVGWGSSVLYMSQYYLQHRQLDPTIITSYGPDMEEYLPNAVRLIPDQPNRSVTLQYQNDSSHGKRTQRCDNFDVSTPPELTADMRAALSTADIVVVATLLPNYSAEYLREALALVPESSLKVLCPQGYFRRVQADSAITATEFNEAEAIVPLFDFLIYSEEDHPRALEQAHTWARMADSPVVVTHAERGATIIWADGAHMPVPTNPIPQDKIIDSVGCGDIFAAALTLAYYTNRDTISAIKTAHTIAARKLTAIMAVDR